LINTFSKVAEYKKPAAFLYTNNEHAEKETSKTIQLTIASKRSNHK
jgi:hypothetical protein